MIIKLRQNSNTNQDENIWQYHFVPQDGVVSHFYILSLFQDTNKSWSFRQISEEHCLTAALQSTQASWR